MRDLSTFLNEPFALGASRQDNASADVNNVQIAQLTPPPSSPPPSPPPPSPPPPSPPPPSPPPPSPPPPSPPPPSPPPPSPPPSSPPSPPPSSKAAVCFATGTHISTANGPVPVERLAVGDRVVTRTGAHRPIRWIGSRTIDLRRDPRQAQMQPIKVAADAFGPGRPARDLLLSPAHAVALDLLGDVLVPIGALANGATIALADVETVTYWHVELDSHDVLLAENLPAESYLDCGNRSFFESGDAVTLSAIDAAAPAERHQATGFCLPFQQSGPLVDFAQARLRARAEALGYAVDAGRKDGAQGRLARGVRRLFGSREA